MMKLQSIKGMNDIVPPDSSAWQLAEQLLSTILHSYGYRQIRLPIIEYTAVFERSIGDVTDIVQKEMYTFEDRNGDSLTLRPEGTAGCVRALLEHGLLNQQNRKLWYIGPMFRHERPQKGRYRQFHQIGVEVFDQSGPDIDAELIMMTARMWSALELNNLRLELNTLGTVANRKQYAKVLFQYFSDRKDELDADSLNRLDRNPMRILDSKNPALRQVIDDAPALEQHLDESSREHFSDLCEILTKAGIEFTVNPHLVRGLDYYSNTVFEWITDDLGAQGTVCAGGRYDGLVELLGGKPTQAIGFAMGLERLVELSKQRLSRDNQGDVDVYIISTSEAFLADVLSYAESIRDADSRWRVIYHCGGGSLKSQMRKADRSGAQLALIIGDQEYAETTVTIKPLRNQADQFTVPQSESIEALRKFVA
jgi:histidyl-tRNA synthetase